MVVPLPPPHEDVVGGDAQDESDIQAQAHLQGAGERHLLLVGFGVLWMSILMSPIFLSR